MQRKFRAYVAMDVSLEGHTPSGILPE
jgi:hypothetical protein